MNVKARFFFLFLFIIFFLQSPPYVNSSAAFPASGIYYIKAEGIVNPVMAEYLTGGIKEAGEASAEAVIIQLDTPGGLDLSMREIIKNILSSEVPVIVYVAPAGGRAASAGVFITYAANIAAMAPGTNIGSAHPVAMGGGKIDETMAKKIENDSVAYIRSIASKRNRNPDWAEKAVRESVNITPEDALKIKVIDMVAASREDLITRLDGVRVALPGGERVIHTKGVEVVDFEMGLRFRVLNAISNPNIAYILMMIGLIGIYFELSNPGLILPGVVGAICLILAFYAFQTLSINYAGLLLIGLAIVFFIVEVKVVSYGLLTIAGMISLILGSLMLFDSPAPFMRLSVWVIVPTVALMTALILGTMYYALMLHRKKPVSGAEGLVGETGTATEDFEREGKIFIEGEYWNAVTGEPLKKGDKVKITEVMAGLTVRVKKV
ncbi:MAG: nodulation protein NfeD [Deltaproteobacteria bacterium]|nr:nodulation protein NfeD [Deltaproteobacteria bacterium]